MSSEKPPKPVSGALLSAGTTKSQKRKQRKAGGTKGEDASSTPASSSAPLPDAHSASLTERAPNEADIQKGVVADELLAHDKEKPSDTIPTPIVDLLNKRLKNVGKKITRIESYSSKPTAELNEDQKKTLATLPALEAVRKELEETKKAVEVLEKEQAKEIARTRAEAEEAERNRFMEELASAQSEHAVRTAKILDFIRLHSALAASDPSIQVLNLAEAEINAIYASVNALMAHESENKREVLLGFLFGEGDIEGIAFSRLLDILDTHMNFRIPNDINDAAEAAVDAILEGAQTSENVGAPGSSLNFMAESELDNNPISFENGAEWIEKEEAPQTSEKTISTVEVERTISPGNSGEQQQPSKTTLNWAEDEGELPPIDGLHAAFGTSGQTTPQTNPPAEPLKQSEEARIDTGMAATMPITTTKATDGSGTSVQLVDEDGFTQMTRGAGRARGRGRGQGHFHHQRGGSTGQRGSFRNGERERGGYRGRGRPSDNNWRGGDGDHRARGRGSREHRGGRSTGLAHERAQQASPLRD